MLRFRLRHCPIRIWLAIAFLLAASPALPIEIDALYQTQAIVTGQGEENRRLGFEICFRQVLVRVSGDQRVLNEPAVIELIPRSGEFVASFRYRDRMEGIPIHDEQGTYDRPHDLYCTFDQTKIDAVLASVGRKPWLDERPTLMMFLSVRNATKSFALASDGADGPYMRDSLAAAAEPLAMPIVLPDTETLAKAGLDAATIPTADPAALAALAAGAVPIVGSLEWSDGELGWVATWRIPHGGITSEWWERGVSFDDAFRDAMRGAAQILSGHGAPG